MIRDTDSEPDWAERYLRYKLGDDGSAAADDPGVPPEAADFMNHLSYIDLSQLPNRDRAKHLETALYALVCTMAGDDPVAERNLHGRPAAAFADDEHVVVVVDGLGEAISVDHETAALLAFAYQLEPHPIDEDEE